MQIQHYIHPKPQHIRHIIYDWLLPAMTGNRIFDFFQIVFKIFQQFVLVRIQKFTRIFRLSVNAKLCADWDIFIRLKHSVFHIKVQVPVCQNIQPLRRVNTQYIECQFLNS